MKNLLVIVALIAVIAAAISYNVYVYLDCRNQGLSVITCLKISG